jgi:hypothetical protein
MDNIKKWYCEKLGESVVEKLKKNKFVAHYYGGRQEAIDYIEGVVKPFNSVGFGGSVTNIVELKLLEIAEKLGKTILNHNAPNLTFDEKLNIRRKELTADIFITSTNAITLDGKLVNVDGTGNRVAAMIFGPKKVLVVSGINKVVENIDEALRRIKFISAPMNAKRVNAKTPCVTTGQCMDCNSNDRICNVITIIEKKPTLTDIEIVIIGENLGF